MSQAGQDRLDKALRLRAQGMSVRDIASLLDTSKSTVSRILSGESVGGASRPLAGLNGRGKSKDTHEDVEGPETVSLDTLADVDRELERVYGELHEGIIDPRSPLKVRVLLARQEHLRRLQSGCAGHVDGADALAGMQRLMDTVRSHLMRHWESEGQPASMEEAFSRLAQELNAGLREWAGEHGLLQEEAALHGDR